MQADSCRQRTGGSLKMCKTRNAKLEKVSGDEERGEGREKYVPELPQEELHRVTKATILTRLKAVKVRIRGRLQQ